ncbi:MAG: hypothetical protein AAFQ96_09645, partial [Pseudomonadota bacterium]
MQKQGFGESGGFFTGQFFRRRLAGIGDQVFNNKFIADSICVLKIRDGIDAARIRRFPGFFREVSRK